MSPSLDDLPDDSAALKAIIAVERAEVQRMAASVRAYEILVQALKLRIARLRRQKFGPSSERIGREVEQLWLALEDLEVPASAADATSEPEPEPEPEPTGTEADEPIDADLAADDSDALAV
jgi:transposase